MTTVNVKPTELGGVETLICLLCKHVGADKFVFVLDNRGAAYFAGEAYHTECLRERTNQQ